jgi:multiple sugar transport system substrate-binding protein
VVAAALTACAPGSAAAPAKSKQLTGEVRWMGYDVAGTRNAELRQSTMNGLAEKVPGAKVTREVVGNGYYGAFRDKLRASMASDTAPDLFSTPDSEMPAYLAERSVLDVDPLVKRDKYDLSDYPKETIEYYRYKGGLFGLPDNSAIIGWYGNVDLFRKAGAGVPAADNADTKWSFAAAAEAAQRIVRLTATDLPGQQRMWGMAANTGTPGWVAWVRSNDGDFAKPDYSESTLHEPAAVDALQFLADLRNKLHVSPTPADQAGTMNDAFNQGRLGMNENCVSCQLGAVRTATTQEFDALVRPAGKGGKRVYHLYAHPQMIWRGTRNPDLSWEALKYFEDVAMVMLVKEGILQGTKVQAHMIKYWLEPGKAPKNGKLWIEATQKYARPLKGTTNWSEIENLFTEELTPLWNGQRTAREAVTALKPRLDALLKAGRLER